MPHRDHQFSCFSLVICRHPVTRKWLAVQESERHDLLWWLPAGAVDPGETFCEAALREGREEAGIDLSLKGILRVEHTPQGGGFNRMRVVFFAEPADPNAIVKTTAQADEESHCASWVTVAELQTLAAAELLRGNELLNWARYLESGGHVWPLGVMGEEGEGPQAPSGAPPARPFFGHPPWAVATVDMLQPGGGGGGGGGGSGPAAAPADEVDARLSLTHVEDVTADGLTRAGDANGWEAAEEGQIDGAVSRARARISLASASAGAEPTHAFAAADGGRA
jgi:8-oxo-dGTP pyrophosphatase MutT (NUDIX family)